MKTALDSQPPALNCRTHRLVAQVSQPAVSPISKSAECEMSSGSQVWKPATQQTWKSALPWLLLSLACLLLGALDTALAATNTVINLDDSGPSSLRQAIADAAPGDTIDFATNQPNTNQPTT